MRQASMRPPVTLLGLIALLGAILVVIAVHGGSGGPAGPDAYQWSVGDVWWGCPEPHGAVESII